MLVSDVVQFNPCKGLVGIEVEAEGDNLPEVVNKFWKSDRDSSLKKADSWEYVLKKPIELKDVPAALSSLQKAIEDNNGVVDESVRAGVHVHINVQDMELLHLFNMIVLYLTLEEVLVSYCGNNRQGNLFCLRASDARYLIHHIVSCISTKRLSRLHTDEIRYASINLKALHQYGSVEFRAMRSTPDFGAINTWVNVLAKIKEASTQFKSPEDIIYNFSNSGPVAFAKEVLGEYHDLFTTDPSFYEKARRGMNNAQDVAFCVDWSTYFRKSNNPFLSNGAFQ